MTTADFCKVSLPGERIALKEIDRTHNQEMMRVLAEGTGVPIERVWETSLLADEGYVFLYRQYGTTEWILPTVNVEGHVSKGLAYCPLCLQSDTEPYYRKSWRYAFNPVCPTHRVFLRQSCPECGNPHYYFGVSGQTIGESPITTCMHCSADIGNVSINTDSTPLIDQALQIQERLNRGIATDSFDILGYGYVRVLPYLRVLHTFMHVLGTSAMASWVIRHHLEDLPKGIDAGVLERTHYGLLVEQRSMEEIATLMCLATTLMTKWPNRLLQFAKKHDIPSHRMFSNRSVPFWITETASEYFFAERAAFSKEEIESARQLLRTKLGRRETPSELKSFMTDGVARHLTKVSKEKRQDVELSPNHFKLEALVQGEKRRLGNHQAQARKLIDTPAELLAEIAVLRRPKQQAENSAPIQPDLFAE